MKDAVHIQQVNPGSLGSVWFLALSVVVLVVGVVAVIVDAVIRHRGGGNVHGWTHPVSLVVLIAGLLMFGVHAMASYTADEAAATNGISAISAAYGVDFSEGAGHGIGDEVRVLIRDHKPESARVTFTDLDGVAHDGTLKTDGGGNFKLFVHGRGGLTPYGRAE